MSTRYQDCVKEGDFVRLPDHTYGTVRMLEFRPERWNSLDSGIGVKIVSIDVEGAPRRWFGLYAPIPVRFSDGGIDTLELIATRQELETSVQAELETIEPLEAL